MSILKTVVILLCVILSYGCGEIKCPKCGGDGKITENNSGIEEYKVPIEYEVKEDCRRCGGRGRVKCDAKYSYRGRCEGGSVYFYGVMDLSVRDVQVLGRKVVILEMFYGYKKQEKQDTRLKLER